MVHHGCVEVIVLRWWLGSQRYGVFLRWLWGLPLPQVRLSQSWEFTFRNGGDWMLSTVSVEQHRAPGGYYPKSDHEGSPGHGVTNIRSRVTLEILKWGLISVVGFVALET